MSAALPHMTTHKIEKFNPSFSHLGCATSLLIHEIPKALAHPAITIEFMFDIGSI
ncbi:MAG: hypothetical protein VXY05_04745 [Pseudomonadota bacterium]|nr:hypothetical protein [Pseudomonadota bacterium]